MCVFARARACVCEGKAERDPSPSRKVRFLILKPTDDARVYAALGVWPVDVNISLYVAQTNSWTSPKEPLERRSVPDCRRMYCVNNHHLNQFLLRHWYLHMHVNLLLLKGFQRAGTHCAVRLNAGLLFWTRATVVCLRPFTQPHLPVISSPNCSSSSVPTQDPDWFRRERDIVSEWAGGRTRIHCAIYKRLVRTGPAQRRPCFTDMSARCSWSLWRRGRWNYQLCPASCAKKKRITLRI